MYILYRKIGPTSLDVQTGGEGSGMMACGSRIRLVCWLEIDGDYYQPAGRTTSNFDSFAPTTFVVLYPHVKKNIRLLSNPGLLAERDLPVNLHSRTSYRTAIQNTLAKRYAYLNTELCSEFDLKSKRGLCCSTVEIELSTREEECISVNTIKIF